MSVKISIIVPVYNAEKTLHKCVDSIINQSYKDWELLLVDDGSIDRSALICDDYVKQDKRIKVFHKQNGGVSSARNVGLDNVKGEWVSFIDSDDWVEIDYLENLYSSDKYDLVASYYIAEGWREWVSVPFKNCAYGKDCMREFLIDCLFDFTFPFGKLFRYSIIKLHNLRFDINISYGEDTLFIYQFIQYINSAQTTSKVTYHYNCYGAGLSKQNLGWNVYWDVLEKLLRAIRHLECIFNWNGQYVCDMTVITFFRRYIYQISSKYSLSYVRKELKLLLNNPVLRKAIKEQKHKTWKRRLFDNIMLCDFLWISAIILRIYKK